MVNRSAVKFYAILRAVLGIVENFCGIKKRLGRHTAFVEANAAERSAFDKKSFKPSVSGSFRRIVSGGTSAENDKFVH